MCNVGMAGQPGLSQQDLSSITGAAGSAVTLLFPYLSLLSVIWFRFREPWEKQGVGLGMSSFQLEIFWDSGIHVHLQAQTQSHNNLGETYTKDGASPSCGVHQNLSFRSLFSGKMCSYRNSCSASVLQCSWDSMGCAASRFWKPGEEFAHLWIKACYNFIRKPEEFHSLLLFSTSLKISLNDMQGAWVWICSWDVKLCIPHVFSVCWHFMSKGF